ncbi:MAG: dihydrolipoyl dehydrogenase [Deltaproteobacteria bacterium]|nr:MAG: dihydrolipoyl dehydrogenase [Deltaproteobacteria bacterium]
MSTSYDLIVIGAGPAGYPAAIRGAQLGLKTACIERELLGGVCLNWGCIPSKALLKTAELANKMRHASDFGLRAGDVSVDFGRVVDRSRTVSGRFNKGVASLFKKYGVDHLEGTARLAGKGHVTLQPRDGDAQELTAKHIVLATGARARTFPGIEVDGEKVMTYREAIVSKEQPERIVILGAGAIGLEFAYFMNAMGTEVIVVEGQAEVLPLEDREIGKEVRRHLSRAGIRFELGTLARSAQADGDEAVVELDNGETLRADRVLVALGISPNSEDLGLEELGVKTERGFVVVDASYRTSVPGVYALGDLNDRGPALAHTATAQAHVCVDRIAGHRIADVDYDNMPSCTYCIPQVASVGLTEEAAKKKGLSYKVGKFPFAANGKAQGAGAPEGFVKVLIDPEYGEILGAHIVGSEATELIANFVMARSAEATAELFVHTVHAHPTHGEAMMEAVAQALGQSVHL